MNIQIAVSNGRFCVKTPYRPELAKAMKEIPTAKWDATKKMWTYSQDDSVKEDLRKLCQTHSLDGDLSLLEKEQKIKEERLPIRSKLPPWNHQIEAIHRIALDRGFYVHGGMGIGKTKMVIDAIQTYPLQCTLILCPSSVVPVWPKEFEKYLCDESIHVLPLWKESIQKRTKQAEHAYSAAKRNNQKVAIIINYEGAWREPFATWALCNPWDLIVLDEAQRIKEARGKQSSFCEKLRDISKHVVGLSGTPMPHSPLDIFAQFRAIDPSIYGTSLTRFKSRYESTYFTLPASPCIDPERISSACFHSDKLYSTWHLQRTDLKSDFAYDMSIASSLMSCGWSDQDIINALMVHKRKRDPHGYTLSAGYYAGLMNTIHQKKGHAGVSKWKNLDDLRQKMDIITLRITRDVLDLPDSTDTTRYFSLDKEEMNAHENLKEQIRIEVKEKQITIKNALTRLLRLQQITGGVVKTDDENLITIGESRRKALEEILDGLRIEGTDTIDPVIVFCRFHADLDNVNQASLNICGKPCLELSGRKHELSEWQKDTSNPVLAVQIQSGGLGVDLTRAAYAIYYSIGFSLGDYEQAKARIHRPGQNRNVTHIHMIASDTVDEAIYDAIAKKKNVVETVLRRIEE
jgi:hypothetical protein